MYSEGQAVHLTPTFSSNQRPSNWPFDLAHVFSAVYGPLSLVNITRVSSFQHPHRAMHRVFFPKWNPCISKICSKSTNNSAKLVRCPLALSKPWSTQLMYVRECHVQKEWLGWLCVSVIKVWCWINISWSQVSQIYRLFDNIMSIDQTEADNLYRLDLFVSHTRDCLKAASTHVVWNAKPMVESSICRQITRPRS